MLQLQQVADCFNHEHQAYTSTSPTEVLESLARRIAGTIEDPRERWDFIDTASMSGLRIEQDFVSTLPAQPRPGAFYCRHCETPEAMPGHEC